MLLKWYMLHRQNTRANTRNIKLETAHQHSSTRCGDTHSHWTEKLPSCPAARASRYIVRGVEYSGNVTRKVPPPDCLQTWTGGVMSCVVCRHWLVVLWVVLCADIDLWCYELCCVQTLPCGVMSYVVCKHWLVVLWVVLCADTDLWCYELCCVQTLTSGVMSCVVCRHWLVVLWVVLCADIDLWCYEVYSDVDL